MPRSQQKELLEDMRNELLRLKELSKTNQKEAIKEARDALIRTGILTKSGKEKKHIVTEPHIGFYSIKRK